MTGTRAAHAAPHRARGPIVALVVALATVAAVVGGGVAAAGNHGGGQGGWSGGGQGGWSGDGQGGWSGGGQDGQVRSIPVEFHVTVQNQGLTPCVGDAAPVAAVVRGTITGPSASLTQRAVAGTVLTHGDGYDASFYRYPDQRYDVVDDLARRGHVSVTYDRLGYGRSDKPNGTTICIGTEATVLHQIVGQLRAGTYRAATRPAFSRVASMGHSAGGFVVEQEAGRFHDVDALGAISTGLEAATPLVTQRATEQQGRCVGAPNGYAGLEANDAQFRSDHIVNVEPRIADALTRNRTKDACGGTRNIPNIAANTAANAAQTVPLLAIAGANDAFFPNVAAHAATFTASTKKTVVTVPQAGHAIAFARTAPVFRNAVESFLRANKF